jgi:ankyrin repeat protein
VTRIIRVAFAAALFGAASVRSISAQTVDFARDVEPLLKTRCYACHGPELQSNGFRLDRRSVVLHRGTTLVPGSSETSRLYLRLIGTEFGSQMPPTGALSTAEIDVIKRWIDQGATWPDALANEIAAPADDPAATRLNEAIRRGERDTVWREVGHDRGLLNRRGHSGTTPLMQATLYGDVAMLARMLDAGGDPNVSNDIGATALMWAVDDLDKVRLLLDRGARPNAQSEDGATALLWAASHTGSAPIVRLLLDRGADPNPTARGGTALVRAATIGDANVVRLLLERRVLAGTAAALVAALHARCAECVTLLRAQGEATVAKGSLTAVLPPQGNPDLDTIRLLLDRGADATTIDAKGHSMLMLAASSDAIAPDALDLLVARGADLRTKAPSGESALDYARLRGETPVATRLATIGGPSYVQPAAHDRRSPVGTANTIDAAVRRSIPLLQRSAVRFSDKAGCVSCHHNALTGMMLATVRERGFAIDEAMARQQLATIGSTLEDGRERALLAVTGPAQYDGLAYTLVSLGMQRYPADAATDAVARGLKNTQRADGHWAIAVHRPPLESSDIENTAMSMRTLQLFAPPSRRAIYDEPIRRAGAWLVTARPQTLEDTAFRVFGLAWSHAAQPTMHGAIRDLVAQQREDGGWAQLPTLASDPYATGLVLVALRSAGASPRDAAYARGVRYLLRTQETDGSWFVQSRTLQLQPYFDSLFPHDTNQWISLTATNWATMALALAR